MGQNVFLCYRLTDAEIVKRVKDDLAVQGIMAWSYDDVPPGQAWRTTMYQALIEAQTVVVFLSPAFIENDVCRRQVYIAQSFRKRIIPVIVYPCLKLLDDADEFIQLKSFHFVNTDNVFLTDSGLGDGYDTCLAQLIAALNPQLNYQPLNTQHSYVCYSSKDADFVRRLKTDLAAQEIYTWSAVTDLRAGDNWRRNMADKVLTCSSLIVVLSVEAIKSQWVQREVTLALLKQIPIIPIVAPRVLQGSSFHEQYTVLRDAALPIYEMNYLNEINWISSDPDYQKGLQDLIHAVRHFHSDKPQRHGIFVSYRRADSRDMTERVYDRLSEEFGPEFVFKDVDSIGAGENFVEVLEKALHEVAVMLVMIGPSWTTIEDEAGKRRLADSQDFVRFEVARALDDEQMVVIPVLLGDTPMPSSKDLPEDLQRLTYRQSVRVRRDPDFRPDAQWLIRQIRQSQE